MYTFEEFQRGIGDGHNAKEMSFESGVIFPLCSIRTWMEGSPRSCNITRKGDLGLAWAKSKLIEAEGTGRRGEKKQTPKVGKFG